MDQIGMFDAKTHFSELVERVAREKRPITVTRRGKPVVDIVPTGEQSTDRMTWKEAMTELAKLRTEITPMGREEIVDLVSEGRR
ncbi:MAG: type II toxin-antitoxin system Phd/YefM family antitoxin [Candidatus Hydrogenedentota bacterium]